MIVIDSTIVVAVLSVMGTVIGSAIGAIATNNKTLYRIEQLERKVEKHNNVADRMILAEDKLKHLQYQLNELKEEVKHD